MPQTVKNRVVVGKMAKNLRSIDVDRMQSRGKEGERVQALGRFWG